MQECEVKLRLNTVMCPEDLSQRFQEVYTTDLYLERIQPIQDITNSHLLIYELII